jgi:hypothetical protein
VREFLNEEDCGDEGDEDCQVIQDEAKINVILSDDRNKNFSNKKKSLDYYGQEN